MAAAFVAAAMAGDGQTTQPSSLSIVVPASSAAGQVAVMTVNIAPANTTTLTTPTGWTLISGPDVIGTAATSWAFAKTLVSGDPGATVTLTFSATARCVADMRVYSGVTQTGLLIALNSEPSATGTPTLPSLTSVPAGAMLDASFCRRRTGTSPTISTPTGYTAVATNGAPANNYGSANLNASETTFYQVTSSGGSVGGESGSAALTSTGVNYLTALPSDSQVVGTLNLTSTGALTSATTPALSGTTATAGAGSVAASGAPAITAALGLSGSGSLVTSGGAPISSPLALTGDGQLGLAGLAIRYVFAPPYVQRYVPVIPPVNALMNFGLAVLRIDGQWIETEYPSEQQLDAADLYFPGGHDNPVDPATAALLTAAGYTVTQIQEN